MSIAQIRHGFFQLGTDEKAIIHVLARRSNEQRQQIKLKFKTIYGKVCVCCLSVSVCVLCVVCLCVCVRETVDECTINYIELGMSSSVPTSCEI